MSWVTRIRPTSLTRSHSSSTVSARCSTLPMSSSRSLARSWRRSTRSSMPRSGTVTSRHSMREWLNPPARPDDGASGVAGSGLRRWHDGHGPPIGWLIERSCNSASTGAAPPADTKPTPTLASVPAAALRPGHRPWRRGGTETIQAIRCSPPCRRGTGRRPPADGRDRIGQAGALAGAHGCHSRSSRRWRASYSA